VGGKNAKKRAVVAVARKLSVLLHRLWVTAEAHEPLYNAHRRTTGGRLETNDGAGKKKLKRRWCSQHRRDDPKVARRTRLLSPDRASDLKVTAQLRTWSIPKEERPLRRLQHLISPRRRISSYAPSHRRECWLTKSADRSIARRAPSCCARPRSGAATSAGSSDL
jgi:hypothetical protein